MKGRQKAQIMKACKNLSDRGTITYKLNAHGHTELLLWQGRLRPEGQQNNVGTPLWHASALAVMLDAPNVLSGQAGDGVSAATYAASASDRILLPVHINIVHRPSEQSPRSTRIGCSSHRRICEGSGMQIAARPCPTPAICRRG